jgi:hypothetical protein
MAGSHQPGLSRIALHGHRFVAQTRCCGNGNDDEIVSGAPSSIIVANGDKSHLSVSQNTIFNGNIL